MTMPRMQLGFVAAASWAAALSSGGRVEPAGDAEAPAARASK